MSDSNQPQSKKKQVEFVRNEISEFLKKTLEGAMLFQASVCGRGYVYIALCGLLFLVGLSFRPALWCAISMGAVFFYQRMRLKELCEMISVERTVEATRIGKGEEVFFVYTIENLSQMECLPFSFRDMTPYFRFQQSVVFVENSLAPGKKMRVRRKAMCEANVGHHTLGPVLVTIQDELGILQFQFGYLSQEMIDVHHGVTINKDVVIRNSKDSPYVGEVSSHKAGPGINLMGLREYREGDSPNSISWKKSAGSDEIYVKEFEKDIARRALIVVDTNARNHLGYGASHTLEIAKSYSLSLCRSYLRNGATVSMIAGQNEVKEVAGVASLILFEKTLHELKLTYFNPYLPTSPMNRRINEIERVGTSFQPPVLVYYVCPYSEEVESYILEKVSRLSPQFQFKVAFIDTKATAELVRERFHHFRELVRWPVYDRMQIQINFARYNIPVNWIDAKNLKGQWDSDERNEKAV